jgi:hypothetical protein
VRPETARRDMATGPGSPAVLNVVLELQTAHAALRPSSERAVEHHLPDGAKERRSVPFGSETALQSHSGWVSTG